MDEDERKKALIKRIEALRGEQQQLQHDRVRWSQAELPDEDQELERDSKECGAIEASIASLKMEKQHLIADIERVNNELDEVNKARTETKRQRKEQTMLSTNEVMAFKSSTARLRREIFSVMKDESVPESIAQSIYTKITQIELANPSAASLRRLKTKLKDKKGKSPKK